MKTLIAITILMISCATPTPHNTDYNNKKLHKLNKSIEKEKAKKMREVQKWQGR